MQDQSDDDEGDDDDGSEFRDPSIRAGMGLLCMHSYSYNFLSLLILLEIIKGSGNFDGDSGLGTSRYKSTMSCTMSDVRMLLFSIV